MSSHPMIAPTAEPRDTLQLLAATKVYRYGVEEMQSVDEEPLFKTLPRDTVPFTLAQEHCKIVQCAIVRNDDHGWALISQSR